MDLLLEPQGEALEGYVCTSDTARKQPNQSSTTNAMAIELLLLGPLLCGRVYRYNMGVCGVNGTNTGRQAGEHRRREPKSKPTLSHLAPCCNPLDHFVTQLSTNAGSASATTVLLLRLLMTASSRFLPAVCCTAVLQCCCWLVLLYGGVPSLRHTLTFALLRRSPLSLRLRLYRQRLWLTYIYGLSHR